MIKGSIVALVSPMFEDGTIDYDSTATSLKCTLPPARTPS